MAAVSVAMAVYNGSKYLREQIDSVLTQLESQDELVISYDRSTDDTWEIISDYARQSGQVHIVCNDNPGVFGNFENAIRACRGDYIFICDQDDRWAENKRSRVLACFESTGADMVIHNGVHISPTGEVISRPFFEISRIGPGKWKNFAKPAYSGCCTAFTRQLAEIILPIPPTAGAYDHWIGTIGEFFGKIEYLDDVLLYHRLHGDNVTPTRHRPLPIIARARIGLALALAARILRERRHA